VSHLVGTPRSYYLEVLSRLYTTLLLRLACLDKRISQSMERFYLGV